MMLVLSFLETRISYVWLVKYLQNSHNTLKCGNVTIKNVILFDIVARIGNFAYILGSDDRRAPRRLCYLRHYDSKEATFT